jgi:protocatechuate 3,4-dioxygenase, beta subunit
MRPFLLTTAWCWLAASSHSMAQQTVAEPPACDCCVFDEQQPTHSQTRIAPDTATDRRLQIAGVVYESDGRTPARNVLMYFYHTNAAGRYAKLGIEARTSHAWWHGYCRGWLKTDQQGRYQINTIRPGAYPNERIPAHIHFWVKAPSQRTCYYLNDFVFTDDPLLTESYWSNVEEREGLLRYEGVKLVRRGNTLVGERMIRLLPQYDRVGKQSGLLVGDACPAFDPYHVWGADRGKRTCPMCAYGQGQGLMLWTRSIDSDTVQRMVRFWETALSQVSTPPSRVFVIYTNPDKLPASQVQRRLEQFAQTNHLSHVAVLYVPSPAHKSTAFLYNINPAVSTTLLFYRRRAVIHNVVDPPATAEILGRQLSWLEQGK